MNGLETRGEHYVVAARQLLTYSFLVWLELREREQMQRRGRPRGVFYPSA